MPYFITDSADGCDGWATVKDDGEVMGCHTTKQAAIDQMVAVSLAEGIEPGGNVHCQTTTGQQCHRMCLRAAPAATVCSMTRAVCRTVRRGVSCGLTGWTAVITVTVGSLNVKMTSLATVTSAPR